MNRQTKRLLEKQEKRAERERARQAPLSRGQGGGRAGGGGRGSGGSGNGGGGSGGGPSPGGGGRSGSGRAAGKEKAERDGRITRARRFLREVRQELRKVAWPTRTEVVTYTVVVLVSVAFVTALVFGLDTAFGELSFRLYKV